MAGPALIARNRIVQLGYIVRREAFDDCVAYWQETTGIGPFYEADITLENQTCRGEPTEMTMHVALGYLGDMQIELIGQNDDHPSAYKEWIERHPSVPRGGLFHHYFLLGEDFDVTYERLERQGASCAFLAHMNNGGRLAYMDATQSLGHYVEFIDRNDGWLEMFDRMRESAANWDGSRPRRPLEELVEGIDV